MVPLPIFSFKMCINLYNVTKFYKKCCYFATKEPLCQTTAQSRSFFNSSGSSKKVRLRLQNAAHMSLSLTCSLTLSHVPKHT